MKKEVFKHFLIIMISLSVMLMPVTFLGNGYTYAQEIEYDFSDEAQEMFNTSIEQTVTETSEPEKVKKVKEKKEKKNKKTEIKVKKGTDFEIALQTAINSETVETGTIAASLEEDIVFNSNLIAPQGSIVYGEILKVKKAGSFYGNGLIQITFNEIMLPNGEVLNFSGNIIKIKPRGSRALKIGIDFLLGAIVTVGSSNPLGILMALVCAASGEGNDVEIPAGSSLTIRLIKPLKTIPYV